MTIAVGILARDGVVVAADSQETVQNYWKQSQGKIFLGGSYQNLDESPWQSAGMCAIAGAGRSGYVDALSSELNELFRDHPSVMDPKDMKRLLEAHLVDFHKDHVAPYFDNPDVNLIIGYERNHHWGLYSTDRGKVIGTDIYAAIGVGAMEALSFLKSLQKFQIIMHLRVEQAIAHSGQAERRFRGC